VKRKTESFETGFS